jgi:hypothetical protein
VTEGIGMAYSRGAIDESVMGLARSMTASDRAIASVAKNFRADAAAISASARAAGLFKDLDTNALGRNLGRLDVGAAAQLRELAATMQPSPSVKAQLAELARTLGVQTPRVSPEIAAGLAETVRAVRPIMPPDFAPRFASAIATGGELAESAEIEESADEPAPELEILAPAARQDLQKDIVIAIAVYGSIIALLLENAQLELAAQILEFLALYIAIFRRL